MKLYLHWDEWYTWWANRDDSLGTEQIVEVPDELVTEYFQALNAFHDVRQKINDYRVEQENPFNKHVEYP